MKRCKKRFPENFGETDSLEEAKPAQRKPSTVVAPATRSTSPKKIRLTKTQLALAKKFKLTPEQYARELIKNGEYKWINQIVVKVEKQ